MNQVDSHLGSKLSTDTSYTAKDFVIFNLSWHISTAKDFVIFSLSWHISIYAMVLNVWSYTSSPPYAFRTRCLIKHVVKFTIKT
jgi:hypothetical protein